MIMYYRSFDYILIFYFQVFKQNVVTLKHLGNLVNELMRQGNSMSKLAILRTKFWFPRQDSKL